VIEWTDEEEESLESQMTSSIEEGRRMLRSVVIATESDIFERIVKVGDPSSKIVELAEKLDVNLIMMEQTTILDTSREEPVFLFK
jgi:urea-proton symporter